MCCRHGGGFYMHGVVGNTLLVYDVVCIIKKKLNDIKIVSRTKAYQSNLNRCYLNVESVLLKCCLDVR